VPRYPPGKGFNADLVRKKGPGSAKSRGPRNAPRKPTSNQGFIYPDPLERPVSAPAPGEGFGPWGNPWELENTRLFGQLREKSPNGKG